MEEEIQSSSATSPLRVASDRLMLFKQSMSAFWIAQLQYGPDQKHTVRLCLKKITDSWNEL